MITVLLLNNVLSLRRNSLSSITYIMLFPEVQSSIPLYTGLDLSTGLPYQHAHFLAHTLQFWMMDHGVLLFVRLVHQHPHQRRLFKKSNGNSRWTWKCISCLSSSSTRAWNMVNKRLQQEGWDSPSNIHMKLLFLHTGDEILVYDNTWIDRPTEDHNFQHLLSFTLQSHLWQMLTAVTSLADAHCYIDYDQSVC